MRKINIFRKLYSIYYVFDCDDDILFIRVYLKHFELKDH